MHKTHALGACMTSTQLLRPMSLQHVATLHCHWHRQAGAVCDRHVKTPTLISPELSARMRLGYQVSAQQQGMDDGCRLQQLGQNWNQKLQASTWKIMLIFDNAPTNLVFALLRLIRVCLHHVCLALYVTQRPALPLYQMANTLAHLRNSKLSTHYENS
jgi:hypothetical protein